MPVQTGIHDIHFMIQGWKARPVLKYSPVIGTGIDQGLCQPAQQNARGLHTVSDGSINKINGFHGKVI